MISRCVLATALLLVAVSLAAAAETWDYPSARTGFDPQADGFPIANFTRSNANLDSSLFCELQAQKSVCEGMCLYALWYWKQGYEPSLRYAYGPYEAMRIAAATQCATLNKAWIGKFADEDKTIQEIVRRIVEEHSPVIVSVGTSHAVVAYEWIGGDRQQVLCYDPNDPPGAGPASIVREGPTSSNWVFMPTYRVSIDEIHPVLVSGLIPGAVAVAMPLIHSEWEGTHVRITELSLDVGENSTILPGEGIRISATVENQGHSISASMRFQLNRVMGESVMETVLNSDCMTLQPHILEEGDQRTWEYEFSLPPDIAPGIYCVSADVRGDASGLISGYNEGSYGECDAFKVYASTWRCGIEVLQDVSDSDAPDPGDPDDDGTGSDGPVNGSLPHPYDIRASEWDESRSSEKVIRVRWECDSVAPVVYEVYRAGTRTSVPEFIGSTEETTYWDDDPEIILCEAYYYYVRACNSTGCSSEATRSGMGTPAKGSYDCRPGRVDSLSIGRITATGLPSISWAPSLYADEYEVLRADSSDGHYESLGVHEPGFVDESLSGLPAGYLWYKIRASNLCGGMLSQAERFEYSPPLGIPSALSAQSECGEVLLQWDAVPGATEYHVYRSAYGEPWTADVLAITGNTAFGDQDLTSLGVFSYRVEACANRRCGDASAPVRVEHASRPTSAVAYFEVTSHEGQVVSLHWGYSPLAAYYEVWRTSDSGDDRVLVYEGPDSFCTDGDADIWTTYHYELSGANSCGSGPALELTVNPPGGMIPSVSARSQCGEILLEWEGVSGATEYRVLRTGPGEDPSEELVAATQSTSFADNPIESNCSYYYRIQATKDSVYGPPSPKVQVWRPGNPPAPTGFHEWSRYGTRLLLSWDPIPYSSSYEVWRTDLSTGGRTRVYEGNQPRCTDSEADKCTSYLYELRGVNDCGFGPFRELEIAALSWIPVTQDCVDVDLEIVEDVGVMLTLHYKGAGACPHPDDGFLFFRVYRDGNYKWGNMPLGYDDDGYSSPPRRDENGDLQWVDESPGDLCESHFYQVEVWTYCGSGGLSEPLYTEVQARPSAPDDFEIETLDDSLISIRWGESPGASEYRVFATFTGVPYALYSGIVTDPICVVEVPEYCGTLHFGVWAGNALCRFGEYRGFRTTLGSAPLTPASLVVADGLSEGVVRIAWPAQDTADWYEIIRESDDGSMATFSRSVELFTEIVPEMCTQYKYSVRACNDCGCSNPTDAIPYRAVDQPAPILDATAEITSDGMWSLSWDQSPGATNYEVERSLDGTLWQLGDPITENQLLIDPVEYCGTLLVRLRAGNDCFHSEWSEALSLSCGQEPGRPSWVTASSATYEDKIRVRWSQADNAEWYEILREDMDGIEETFTSAIASHWDRRLDACSEYTYSVRACNECGCSSYTTPTSGSTAGVSPATAPTGVTATQYDGPNWPSGGYPDRIVVEWESLSEATTYEVYRSTTENSGFRKIGETNSTSYTDRSASTCIDYFYRVIACSDCGCGGQSQSALGSRGCDVPAPAVVASDGSECTEIHVSWSAVSIADGYDVLRAESSSGPWEVVRNNLVSTSMDDQDVIPGEVYWYSVNAYKDRWGSDMYHDLDVDSGYAASLPQAPILHGFSGGCDRIEIHFSHVECAEYYELFVSSSYDVISSGGSSPLYHDIDGDCPDGNSYQVRACSDSGCGERSNAMVYLREPGGALGLTISDGGCALCFDLTWNAVSCVDYYTVYRSESPNGSYVEIDTTTSTDYFDSLNDDIDYWYKVSATTACGESELSAAVGTCEVTGGCP